ncbi:hypothetical protein D3C76_1181350 [compost metagenome]
MKPGSKGLVLNRVDSCTALVINARKRGETTKNVTGSPYPVSKSRMLCALSVDALCCFGAENFPVVRKSYNVEALPGPLARSCQDGVAPPALCWCVSLHRLMRCVEKNFAGRASGRYAVIDSAFAGMLRT